jgi:predicted O-linked N-acetylglucosamine transferase (SPINDLY family)
MDGPDSDREYSEDLVRLPNLSINYSPPPRTLLPISRADLGMRDDAIVYWCCQVIYKYLPQYDWVYAEIAAQVPTSQFAFITIQPQSEMALLFKDRISRAFSAKGLDPAQHIIFLAGLNGDEFATAASLCDISLDAFEWSGCNSSLETMAQGTPVISCPGEFMRGRHSEAILKMIGCDDLIAPTPQSFVELAVRLGTNSALRSQVRSRVRERIPLAYNDLSCVRELEKLIKSWLMPDS